MKKIEISAGRPLKWTQPSARKMEYELQSGDELVATLVFRSSWGSFATARTAESCWTFKRVGFFKTHVTVRTCDDPPIDVATFHNNTWKGGGTLETGGGEFRASTNLWQTKYTFNTRSGEPLVEFKTGGMIHLSAEVEVHPQAARLAALPLILTLGWYLAVMMKNDDSAGAAAAAAG